MKRFHDTPHTLFNVNKLLLTAHNWQKLKRVFLTCPCHKLYRGT